jgi:hypothetical protein
MDWIDFWHWNINTWTYENSNDKRKLVNWLLNNSEVRINKRGKIEINFLLKKYILTIIYFLHRNMNIFGYENYGNYIKIFNWLVKNSIVKINKREKINRRTYFKNGNFDLMSLLVFYFIFSNHLKENIILKLWINFYYNLIALKIKFLMLTRKIIHKIIDFINKNYKE